MFQTFFVYGTIIYSVLYLEVFMSLTRGERFKDARIVHNQHGKQSMREVERYTDVSASVITYLESDSEGRNVGYSTIVALAKHYGVSIDFLLGLSPNPTTNKDLDAICQYTGLSQRSVEYLVHSATYEQGNVRLSLLNWLIDDPRFSYQLLDEMAKYCMSSQQYAAALKKSKEETEELKKLSGGDEQKELKMLMSGEFTPTVSGKDLSTLSDLKDVHYLKSQRALDNVLDCLVYNHLKKCGLNPGNK